MAEPYQLPLPARPLRMLSAEGIAESDRIERWRNCMDREDLDDGLEPDAPRCAGEHARPYLHDYEYQSPWEREDQRFTEER